MASVVLRDETATGRTSEEFVMLVGDRQIEDLSAEIDLTTDPVVSFVKLVPLVGG
jgi:hypothetical protein